MERIKISLPERFSFSTNIAIRIADLNYAGHVGTDAFLALVQEAPASNFCCTAGTLNCSLKVIV